MPDAEARRTATRPTDRVRFCRCPRILVRADGAGFCHTFCDHLVEQGLEYSVGFAVTDDVRTAISQVPRWAWNPAVDPGGGLRDGADVTGLLELTGWPEQMRVIVRRERPHPGPSPPPQSRQEINPHPAAHRWIEA